MAFSPRLGSGSIITWSIFTGDRSTPFPWFLFAGVSFFPQSFPPQRDQAVVKSGASYPMLKADSLPLLAPSRSRFVIFFLIARPRCLSSLLWFFFFFYKNVCETWLTSFLWLVLKKAFFFPPHLPPSRARKFQEVPGHIWVFVPYLLTLFFLFMLTDSYPRDLA